VEQTKQLHPILATIRKIRHNNILEAEKESLAKNTAHSETSNSKFPTQLKYFTVLVFFIDGK
jgi:hypothetical protein